jgi:hypothetical protein
MWWKEEKRTDMKAIKSTDTKIFVCTVVTLGMVYTAGAGLVNHWSFDETTGSTAVDSGSGGNDGAINGTTIGQTGKVGKAYSFDGSGDNVVITDYKGITGTAARTISLWVKTADSGSGSVTDSLIGWGSAAANGKTFGVGINKSSGNGDVGAPRLNVRGGYQTGSPSVVNDEWRLIVVSVPAGANTINDPAVRFFVDGGGWSSTGSSNRAIDTGSDWDVTIGIFADPNDRDNNGAFKGMMDDVAIWDYAFTQGLAKGLSDVGNVLSYDAGKFNDLKTIFSAESGSVEIGGLQWSYASDLGSTLGLSGSGGNYTLVLSEDGTGLKAIPEPNTISVLLLILGVAHVRRRISRA